MKIPRVVFFCKLINTNISRNDSTWLDFDKTNTGPKVYMYVADLIEALHKDVDLSYSMDLFVSKVVGAILLFVVFYILKSYILGNKIKILFYLFSF